MKRKSRRNWKIKLAEPKLHELAHTLVVEHTGLITSGYRLMASSGFWRTAERGITARFVYRKRVDDGSSTVTHTIRGIGT